MELVSIITPYTPDRSSMIDQLQDYVNSQDYPNTEWLTDDSDLNIGAKLNRMCQDSQGSIILRMDSDDYYAPDWVSKSVAALDNNDMTGLRQAYFYNIHTKVGKYYRTFNPQPYCMGATMCFRKHIWERNPFNEKVKYGEDSIFMGHAGKVKNHDYIDGFTALIHNTNTQSHIAFQTMRVVNNNKIPYAKFKGDI